MPIEWILPPPPPPLPQIFQKQTERASVLHWELLEKPELPVNTEPPGPAREPLSAEQVEAVVNSFPLQRSDYRPLLRLSPAVPTAELLPQEQWRIEFFNISPFSSDTGTGNQNYAVNFDLGLSHNLQVSAFVSQADDPLNAPLSGFTVQPANFGQSYGIAARWQLLNHL